MTAKLYILWNRLFFFKVNVRMFKNDMLICGAGCGCGVVIPVILEKYWPDYNGQMPYIGEYMGQFGTWATGGTAIAGAGALIAWYFVKSPFLFGLGVVAILSGVLKGLFAPASSRALNRRSFQYGRRPVRRPAAARKPSLVGRVVTGRNTPGHAIRGGNSTAVVKQPEQVRPDSTEIPYDGSHKYTKKTIIA